MDASPAPIITEAQAWEIADAFAAESQQVLGAHMVAVAAVGSLPVGGYVPGRSDIDLIVVVQDRCPDGLMQQIKQMAERYWQRYRFRKGFGGYAIRRRDLRPPFGPLHDIAFEILQLKQSGRVILGSLDLQAIPEPSPQDMKRSLVSMVHDILGAWQRTYPPPIDADDARVNAMLYWLRIFVWDRTGAYLLQKRDVLTAFSKLARTQALVETLRPVHAYVNQKTDHIEDAALLGRKVEAFVLDHVRWAREAAGGKE